MGKLMALCTPETREFPPSVPKPSGPGPDTCLSLPGLEPGACASFLCGWLGVTAVGRTKATWMACPVHPQPAASSPSLSGWKHSRDPSHQLCARSFLSAPPLLGAAADKASPRVDIGIGRARPPPAVSAPAQRAQGLQCPQYGEGAAQVPTAGPCRPSGRCELCLPWGWQHGGEASARSCDMASTGT